jgi:hypothetical protein
MFKVLDLYEVGAYPHILDDLTYCSAPFIRFEEVIGGKLDGKKIIVMKHKGGSYEIEYDLCKALKIYGTCICALDTYKIANSTLTTEDINKELSATASTAGL